MSYICFGLIKTLSTPLKCVLKWSLLRIFFASTFNRCNRVKNIIGLFLLSTSIPFLSSRKFILFIFLSIEFFWIFFKFFKFLKLPLYKIPFGKSIECTCLSRISFIFSCSLGLTYCCIVSHILSKSVLFLNLKIGCVIIFV